MPGILIVCGSIQMLGHAFGCNELMTFGYSLTFAPLSLPFTGEDYDSYYRSDLSYEENEELQKFLKEKYQKTQILFSFADGEMKSVPFKETLIQLASPYRYHHSFKYYRASNLARKKEALKFGFCPPSAVIIRKLIPNYEQITKVRRVGHSPSQDVEVSCQ